MLQMAAAAAAPSAPMVSAFELRTQVHPRRSRMPPAHLLSCPRSSAHDSFPAMLLPCLTRHSSSLQMPCWCRIEADPSSRCRQRLPARRYVASPATCVALIPYDAKRAMLNMCAGDRTCAQPAAYMMRDSDLHHTPSGPLRSRARRFLRHQSDRARPSAKSSASLFGAQVRCQQVPTRSNPCPALCLHAAKRGSLLRIASITQEPH